MASGALFRCLGVDVATFGADYWDQLPLLRQAAGADFTDLISSPQIDELVAARGLRLPFFQVVNNAEGVGGITKAATAGSRLITDLADDDAIRDAYAAGATLVLQSLHRNWPPIVELCRELASELGHRTQCNAYITPAGNAQGFAFHHDTHDVIVLQIEGSKHWQIHTPIIERPTRQQRRSGSDLVADRQQPLIDVTLRPGDALYLPRGYVHAASTTDEPSVHLTIGIHPTTQLDVVTRLVERLGGQEDSLRRALPVAPRSSGVDDRETATTFVKSVADWLLSLPAADVAAIIREQLREAAPIEPLGVLAQSVAAATVGPDTRVRPRRGLPVDVQRFGDRVVIVTRTARIDLPAIAEPIVAGALAAPSTPAELASHAPGCDVSDAVVVVRRLLREGVLAAGS